jgi:cold shock CspA family protein
MEHASRAGPEPATKIQTEGSRMSEKIAGVVLSWNPERHFGIVQGDGRKFVASGDDIQPDAIGRCYLVENELVDFLAGPPKPNGAFPNALNVVPVWRDLGSANLDTYRDYATIFRWFGDYGFARRESGDELYVHVSKVITEGESELKVGDVIWTRIAPPERKKVWTAIAVCCLEPDDECGWRLKPLLAQHEDDLAKEEAADAEPVTTLGVALTQAVERKNASFIERHRGQRLRDIPVDVRQ